MTSRLISVIFDKFNDWSHYTSKHRMHQTQLLAIPSCTLLRTIFSCFAAENIGSHVATVRRWRIRPSKPRNRIHHKQVSLIKVCWPSQLVCSGIDRPRPSERDGEWESNENILLVMIFWMPLSLMLFVDFFHIFLPSFLFLALARSPRPSSSYKCRSMLLSEYYKNTFFIAMKIKAQPIYTRYYVTWCVSLFPISFLLAVGFIYLHMPFLPPFPLSLFSLRNFSFSYVAVLSFHKL